MSKTVIILLVVIVGGLGLFYGLKPELLPDFDYQPDAATKRELALGTVLGSQGRYESYAWLGLPYAKPPVGDLRWRAPRTLENPWSETMQAVALPNACPQIGSPLGGMPEDTFGKSAGSEDCLYLNIWTPQLSAQQATSKRLPVMVWVHGGANIQGFSGFYDGGRLAATQDVIVVTINYRVGGFGWLYLDGLNDGSDNPLDRSGNYGLLDIIESLKWVQNNIAVFGGDPNNVTLFGESAGARNVLAVLTSPLANGLYHKAIAQSGYINDSSIDAAQNYKDDPVSPGNPFSSKELLLKLLINEGQAQTRAQAKEMIESFDAASLSEYLRSKSKDEILLALSIDGGQRNARVVDLIQDGSVMAIESQWQRLSQAASVNNVPIMIGTNRDESKLYLAFNPEFVDNYLGVFYKIKDNRVFNTRAKYLSDRWKVNGVDRIVRLRRQVSDTPIFAYRFDWDEEPDILGNNFSNLLGAAHGFEIPFVFGHFYLGPSSYFLYNQDNRENRITLSNAMMSYWAQFAYEGNPGMGRNNDLPQWRVWNNDTEDKFIIFDTPNDGGVRMSGDELNHQLLVSRIANKDGLQDQEEQCAMYRLLYEDTMDWDDVVYRSLGSQGCVDNVSPSVQ